MLSEQIAVVKQNISNYARMAGRNESAIRLIAVSKTFSASAIRDSYNVGLREFGENYADELATKFEQLRDLKDIRWVFIGQLQSNKIQKIMKVADEVQSIASEKHARYVDRYAKEFGKPHFPVWIVVNAASESSKQGVPLNETENLGQFIERNCPNLTLQGLMAIPPATFSDSKLNFPASKAIPDLYLNLRKTASNIGLGKLSLGMSSDLALSIFSGSDCVRIGSAIFGNRI